MIDDKGKANLFYALKENLLCNESFNFWNVTLQTPWFQDFAEQYVNCNPSSEQGAVDAILILSFAIVMLNTDLHSPNVKRRMTEAQFITNLKGKCSFMDVHNMDIEVITLTGRYK